MEAVLGTFLTELVKSGALTDSSGILIFIISTYVIIKGIILPMKARLDGVVTKEDYLQNDLLWKQRFELIEDNLNKLHSILSDTTITSGMSSQEMKDLRKELKEIRTMILQFQGHLMYSSYPRTGLSQRNNNGSNEN